MSSNSRTAADDLRPRLLKSIVEVARNVFGAAAASVFLVDSGSGDLIFEAVAGEGEDSLLGTRFPGDTGIAGWAIVCGQPLFVDDLSASPQFARDAATSTGYVPTSIMAAPLICGDECVGVLEVLDRDSRQRCDLGDMEALGLLATEIATVMEILVWTRPVDAGLPAGAEEVAQLDMPLLRRVAERLPRAPTEVGATATKLLRFIDELLADDA